MTEYLDEHEEDFDEEVGDFEAREQIANLRAQIEAREEEDEINRQIGALEREHGSSFTYEETQQLGQLIDAGHDPQDAYEAVSPQTADEADAEAEYSVSVERLEREENRALSEAERESVWQAVVNDEDGDPLARRGHPPRPPRMARRTPTGDLRATRDSGGCRTAGGRCQLRRPPGIHGGTHAGSRDQRIRRRLRMSFTTADRIEEVRHELKSIRHELSPIGSSPHAAAHDLVKEVEKTLTTRDGDLSVYLREPRS